MKKAIIVTDLGYGDAGKGSMVDYLAGSADASLVVRHNGGPQAAHNVITSDGRHHTFAQFGSASFIPGSRTHLSRFMLVNPFNLTAEAEHLVSLGEVDILSRMTIDGEAMVITPWHIAANRLRELVRGGGRHGSCGQGIGEVKLDSIHFPEAVLRVSELSDKSLVRRKLAWVRNLKLIQLTDIVEQLPEIEQSQKELDILKSTDLIGAVADFYHSFSKEVNVVNTAEFGSITELADLVIFEGAQAVLLDESYGFHPYTTWSVTTDENAQTLLREIGFQGPLTRLGVIRAYMARHGAGPFVSEDKNLSRLVPDYHNVDNNWQHGFRVGHLDFVALRYALAANQGVDELAVTNLDRLSDATGWAFVDGYLLPDIHRSSPYFTGITDGMAAGIRLGPKNRRDYQESITRVLLDSRPTLRQAPACDAERYLGEIEKALGVPVRYTSFGPKAKDKNVRVP